MLVLGDGLNVRNARFRALRERLTAQVWAGVAHLERSRALIAASQGVYAAADRRLRRSHLAAVHLAHANRGGVITPAADACGVWSGE